MSTTFRKIVAGLIVIVSLFLSFQNFYMDQHWQKMANLVFDLHKKVISKDDNPVLVRIYDKMKQTIEDAGFYLYNPVGERYVETRTDIEANISGTSTSNLVIKEVIKPILYKEDSGKKILLQKGVVIVNEKG